MWKFHEKDDEMFLGIVCEDVGVIKQLVHKFVRYILMGMEDFSWNEVEESWRDFFPGSMEDNYDVGIDKDEDEGRKEQGPSHCGGRTKTS